MNASSGSSASPDVPRPNTTPCPRCTATAAEATVSAGALIYLRCQICSEIWSIEDRRHDMSRRSQSSVAV